MDGDHRSATTSVKADLPAPAHACAHECAGKEDQPGLSLNGGEEDAGPVRSTSIAVRSKGAAHAGNGRYGGGQAVEAQCLCAGASLRSCGSRDAFVCEVVLGSHITQSQSGPHVPGIDESGGLAGTSPSGRQATDERFECIPPECFLPPVREYSA